MSDTNELRAVKLTFRQTELERMSSEGEVLRVVLFMQALRDGDYGTIPSSARDAINSCLDRYVGELTPAGILQRKRDMSLAFYDICKLRDFARSNGSVNSREIIRLTDQAVTSIDRARGA